MEIKLPARNLNLDQQQKEIDLGSLHTKLLGGASSQVLSIQINLC